MGGGADGTTAPFGNVASFHNGYVKQSHGTFSGSARAVVLKVCGGPSLRGQSHVGGGVKHGAGFAVVYLHNN